MDEKILKELKGKLQTEKKRIEDELNIFAKPTGVSGDYVTEFENIGSDMEDNASEVEEYADNLALENSLEKQLKEINEALIDMDNGGYGICKNCGKEISIERLRAYPAARTCIKC